MSEPDSGRKKTIKLNIFDTGSVTAVTSAHYRNAMGAIICFDLSRRETFDNLESWVTKVKDCVSDNTTIFLVGCKSDICQIAQKKIDDFIYQMNMMYFDDS